ncbi:MAG: hypothetical protein HKN32_07645, partial [Flavobacteriales bacterium]|nr:hypothetical protein [Flavobacteriales bacterium]
ALFNPDNRDEVILATEVGCWSSADISVGFPNWVPSNTGLANTRVDMLQHRPSDNQVAAATHGRGLFTGYFNTPTTLNDAGISAIIEPNGDYCMEDVDLIVTLRNYGSVSLTSVDIIYDIDGGAPTTFNWTGTLLSGNSVDLTLASVTVPAGAHTFNVATQNPNGLADDDAANDAASSNFTTLDGTLITFTLLTDCWGEEVSWDIQDALSNVVFSQGPNFYGDQTTYVEQYCLAAGCYTFTIYDTFGDGMNGTGFGCPIDGDYDIYDDQGNLLVDMTAPGAAYGASASHPFCVPVAPLGTYYSVASGNASGAIWDTDPAGPGALATFDCTSDFIIQSGHVVNNDLGNFSLRDLTIQGGGTFDLAAGGNTMSVCGDLIVDGTFLPNDSRVSFVGTASQTLGGTTNVEYFDMQLDNSAGLMLTSDQRIVGALDLQNGTFDVNGQNWTFASYAGATGRFMKIQPAASFSGSATMQNYASGGTQGWRMMGMTTAGDLTQWDDDIPTTGFPNSQWPFFGFTSILSYDETLISPAHYDSGFVEPADISEAVLAGNARFAFFNGPVTLDNVGVPFTGPITTSPTWTNSATVPFNDGWNLVANSYQATIDWDAAAGWTKTNLDASIYAWDNDLQQWATYTSGGASVNGGSRYLAPHQGFWIKANAAAPQFSYNMDVIADQYVEYIRETEEFTPTMMKISIFGNDYSDETALVLADGASSGLDNQFDGLKLRSENPDVPTIFTLTEDDEEWVETSIHSRETLEAGTTIPMHIVAPFPGEYVISFDDYSAIDFGACLTVEDLITGDFTLVEPGLNLL